MAKNQSREFATMSDDERREFARAEGGAAPDTPEELDFDDPRDEQGMGRHYASLQDEVADPENRDGASALLDDEQHRREVGEEIREGHAGDLRRDQ